MSLALPRADDLRIIRALCQYLQSRGGQAPVSTVEDWMRGISMEVSKRPWRRSRIYHYTSAARDLCLVHKPDVHTFTVTEAGKRLGAEDRRQNALDPLGEEDKARFTRHLFRSDSVRTYLAFYMPSGECPKSASHFRDKGKPISIVRKTDKRYALKTAAGETRCLTRAEKWSFAWTLFGWLRMLDLADSIYHEKPLSFLVRDREVRVFYPLRTLEVSSRELSKMLDELSAKKGKDFQFWYVPDLLVQIGAAYGIPKDLFLANLVQLHRRRPARYYLEMMSSLRFDERSLSHHQYINFPKVDGVYRSHLCLNLRA